MDFSIWIHKIFTFLSILTNYCQFSIFMITEEILEQSRATWFSKKGGNLLYATFNATSVGEVSFKLYGDESNDLGTNFEENSKSEPNLYGKTKTLRYPKVRFILNKFLKYSMTTIKKKIETKLQKNVEIIRTKN